MDYVKTYGNYIIKKSDTNPKLSRKMIEAGITEEIVKLKLFPKKEMPEGMRRLSHQGLDKVRRALRDPLHSCWTNIFAPVEIMQCFDLNCLSMECLASFLSGFKIEDELIDAAETKGVSATMCSYHKDFIGASARQLLPQVPVAVTTSLACDGNISTFRHIEDKGETQLFVIDVPYEYSEASMKYTSRQLAELISFLEEKTGKSFDIDRLREVIRRENESKKDYIRFLSEIKRRYYPKTMTLDLYMLFATHLDIGSRETQELFAFLTKDIKKYPMRSGKAIFWTHLMPYYQETLQHYFDYNEDYYIHALDMNMDYMKKLDEKRPIEALARKMILNMYNGPYERKVKLISSMVERFESDALISFCQWGCKQSSGGVELLKSEMKKQGVPMLILDGDALDRRNSHDGQIKTRLEAFFEIL